MTSKTNFNFQKIIKATSKIIEQSEKKSQHLGKKHCPNFNSLDFWSLNENKYSQILSFLLNPIASHQQGGLYLSVFLKTLNINTFKYKDARNVVVRCEDPTDENRRIDITIFTKDTKSIIGIENKVNLFTIDQNRQVEHYFDQLKKRHPKNYTLVYLTPGDRMPSVKSIANKQLKTYISNDKFRKISWDNDIVHFLDQIIDLTENQRLKSFIQDYRNNILNKIVGIKDQLSMKDLIDFLSKDAQSIKTAFSINAIIEDLKKKLIQKFHDETQDIAKSKKIKFRSIVNNYNQQVEYLYLQSLSWEGYEIGIHIDHLGSSIFGGLYHARGKKNNSLKDYLADNDVVLSERENKWVHFGKLYENFPTSSEFYENISNGMVYDEIFKFIESMNSYFDKKDK